MNGTFQHCFKLTSVNIPQGVINMHQTFYWCFELTSVNIPQGVTSMNGTFISCSSLTSVVVPQGVTSMNGTFSGCSSLTSVNVPEGVTDMTSTFFGCVKLGNITSMSDQAFDKTSQTFGLSSDNFTGISNPAGTNILYVPAGATGYDSGVWLDPLQHPDKCNFTISYVL
jgi:hypothetical protein